MNPRFVLPAAVAMAFHAFVFFGFHPSPSKPVSGPLALVGCTLQPLPPDEPPEPVPSDEEPATIPHRSPDLPRIMDPVQPITNDRQQIVIPTEVLHPGPIHPAPVISPGRMGETTGTDKPGLRPYDSTQLDNVPHTRLQVPPAYPYEASHDGRRGEVLVRFTVDEAGRVLNPQVIQSTDSIFEAPTLRAVAKWRFEPGRRNGRAVRFQMAVPVRFTVSP